ncbi:MAG TPA: phosphatidate cytidylyltransferase [Phycisphaerales bacterium]|nr:phosphatidate cytidylyltransferase [Phycisphaerales bacterium]
MLKYRLITGPLLILLILGVVALDERFDAAGIGPRGWLLLLIALVAGGLAAVEMTRIIQANALRTNIALTIAAVWAGTLAMYFGAHAETLAAGMLLPTSLTSVFVVSLLMFSRGNNVSGVLPAAGAVILAMAYLGVLLGFFLALRQHHSAWWIVGVVLTTKSCDIGAYFTGTAIGRHKLIPWLSPGKTWEGLAGGVVFATLVGLGMAAMSRWLADPTDHIPLWLGAIAGGVFAVVGQLGDLAMSLFKRGAGVKDSSRILPGMGGVLDVIDSPLLVAPVAYWLLVLII